jgi:hypothetical protein
MKCITYISETTCSHSGENAPPGLAKIYFHSKKSNLKIGVTSLLAYKNGYYLQALEGDDQAVDQAFSNVKKIGFHKSLTVLFESSIEKRFFPGWPVRLASELNSTPDFLAYLNGKNIDTSKIEALAFFSEKKPASGIKNTPDNNNVTQTVRRKMWPNFNKIRPTPDILDLCARMVSRSLRHSEIFHSGISSEQVKIYKNLFLELEKNNLLIKGKLNLSPQNFEALPEKSGFYNKMKNYLSRKSSV